MAVRVQVDGRETVAPEGSTLFECAESLGITVPTSCRMQGKCRECLVEIEQGASALTAIAPEEGHLPSGFRLSCRSRLTVNLPPGPPGGAVNLPPGPPGGAVGPNGSGSIPLVRCRTLRRGRLQIEDHTHGLGDRSDRLDPSYRRRGSVLLRDGEEVGRVEGPIRGVAIDLGTTTVVLRLIDLESGQAVATQSFENPQRFGGSDVMARILYDQEHRGRLLQRVLLGYLARAIEAFPCDGRSIVEIVVAGNSTMRDLFFGLDVSSIGQHPYRSMTEHQLRDGQRSTTALVMPARRLKLPVHPRARVYGLPLIGGHVGGDAAACLLATGIADREELTVCMDIGTNTEVLIGNRHRILAVSCPAGPAFEGGGVLCGMPGLDGAIERLRFNGGGELELGVVGHREPRGLCGSGLVDVLSELLRTERMSSRGRLRNGCDRFVVDEGRDIFLTEKDISELAQAKGANAAGLRIVLGELGIGLDEIERFYLAGGFGKHLDWSGARRIGLVPDLPRAKAVLVGNAALEGAARVLTSVKARAALEMLVSEVRHIALDTHPHFFDYFVDGCQFEPIS